MLIRFIVTRKDNGAPVQGARIEVEKAEGPGITDSQGKTEIVTFWSGNFIYKVTAAGYDKINGTVDNRDIEILNFGVSLLVPVVAPPPNYAPPTGESIEGQITEVCQVITKTAFGENWFKYRQIYTGHESQYFKGYDLMKSAGLSDPQCFLPAPTAPSSSGVTQESLDTQLSELKTQIYEQIETRFSWLNSVLSDTISSIIEYLETTFTALIDALRAEIQALISPVWDALDEIQQAGEFEASAWRAAYSGIWDKLESWLTDNIIRILIKGLDKELDKKV